MGRTSRTAFTIVELIVVITVIALILAIAVPGLSAMNAESRFNAATQTINGVLTRTYYAALADMNMTAVRFVPGQWDYDETAEAQRPTGRQHLVSYSYVGTSAGDPAQPGTVEFAEYFQRRPGIASVQLPEDIWVAPVEALDAGSRTLAGWGTLGNFGQDFVLRGERGVFALDAADSSQNFRQADDFLLMFDPQTGLRGGLPTPTRLKAYVPAGYPGAGDGLETYRMGSGANPTYFQRYTFSGIVIYRRDLFLSQGDEAGEAEVRQSWLRGHGRPYLVHRFSGGLVMGTQGIED